MYPSASVSTPFVSKHSGANSGGGGGGGSGGPVGRRVDTRVVGERVGGGVGTDGGSNRSVRDGGGVTPGVMPPPQLQHITIAVNLARVVLTCGAAGAFE